MIWDILSWTFLVLGSLFMIVGSIGLLRFPDFYSRTHAAGITDTMGASLILIGLMFSAQFLVIVKLALIIVFLMHTTPTSAHALVKAAWLRGLKPWTVEGRKDR